MAAGHDRDPGPVAASRDVGTSEKFVCVPLATAVNYTVMPIICRRNADTFRRKAPGAIDIEKTPLAGLEKAFS